MKDIIIDDNGNFTAKEGDFVIERSEGQTSRLLIAAWTGEFKNAPRLGGNALEHLNGIVGPYYMSDITDQLKTALIPVKNVNYLDGYLNIELT